jgi:SAM-dependent methyltransferase
MTITAELYLRMQAFNPAVAFLHKQRFRALALEVRAISLPRPIRVLDLGAGPAKAFEVLDRIARIDNTGVDTNINFFQFATSRYGQANNFRMFNASFLDDSLMASLGPLRPRVRSRDHGTHRTFGSRTAGQDHD